VAGISRPQLFVPSNNEDREAAEGFADVVTLGPISGACSYNCVSGRTTRSDVMPNLDPSRETKAATQRGPLARLRLIFEERRQIGQQIGGSGPFFKSWIQGQFTGPVSHLCWRGMIAGTCASVVNGVAEHSHRCVDWVAWRDLQLGQPQAPLPHGSHRRTARARVSSTGWSTRSGACRL